MEDLVNIPKFLIKATQNALQTHIRLFIVITSYSIHYTKLYDKGCLPRTGAAGNNGNFLAHNPGHHIQLLLGQLNGHGGEHLRLDQRFRITSYNVCYTKLLRSKVRQYSAALVLVKGSPASSKTFQTNPEQSKVFGPCVP